MLASEVSVGSDKRLHGNWEGQDLPWGSVCPGTWTRPQKEDHQGIRLLAMPSVPGARRCGAPAGPGAEGSEARPGSFSPGPMRVVPGKHSHKALECLSPQTELDLWGPLVALLHFNSEPQLGHHSRRTGQASGTWDRGCTPAALAWALLGPLCRGLGPMGFLILSITATQHTVRSRAGQTVRLLISHGYGRRQW